MASLHKGWQTRSTFGRLHLGPGLGREVVEQEDPGAPAKDGQAHGWVDSPWQVSQLCFQGPRGPGKVGWPQGPASCPWPSGQHFK